MLIFEVFIWCVLGYIGGRVAARKGYPPTLGVFVGMFIGPLGLLVGALLPKTRRGREQATLERRLNAEAAAFRRRQKCPACGEEISARAVVCGFCGHRCDESSRLVAVPSPQIVGGTVSPALLQRGASAELPPPPAFMAIRGARFGIIGTDDRQ
jgi:ribosomal protein L37AE/L43A